MPMRVCAIHQPNFFPWLGFFDKMLRSDVFVILDQVNYQKSGSSMSSWCNRVKLRVRGQGTWVSCPVVREHGVQIIDQVRINDSRPWRTEMQQILASNYRDAPYFESTYELVSRLLEHPTDMLADFNVNAIRVLAERLGCKAELVRQSEMALTEVSGSERLVAICQAVNAGTYLSGDGSGGYLDESAFGRAGIELRYQQFSEPSFGDGADVAFIPRLSVIDRMMFTAI